MRLKSIYIRRFKNLSNFDAEFDAGSSVSVLVGRNGTGKSNLLEALTIIFRDLDLGRIPEIAFRIRYECRGLDIEIDNYLQGDKLSVLVNGEKTPKGRLGGTPVHPRLLPDFVFGYYSGPSDRLREHYSYHQEAFSKELRDGVEAPLRRLFYAQPIHSQFVLLAFFLSDNLEPVLRDYLGIESFDSALFVLKEPYWAHRKTLGSSGNEKFWNARGTVASLLDELSDLSLAPLRLRVASSGRERGREQIFLYLKDRMSLQKLAESRYGGSAQQLFKAFESILSADLLAEVRVRVRTRGAEHSLVFRELSEGEQQLLMVLGLLRFTAEDESLFLLDEPDTHLNAAWSLDYVRMLESGTGSSDVTSQLLMATHDPLVISGLLKEQVLLLQKKDGLSEAHHPDVDPRGLGVAGLLTSEIYGLASDLDAITLIKVERHRELAAAETLDAPETQELSALSNELRDLGFTFTTHDRLYNQFEKAMLDRSRPVTLVQSREQQQEEAQLARQVLDELLHESAEK